VYDKIHIQIIVGNKLGKPLVGEPKIKIVYTIMMDLKQIGFENEVWEKVAHVYSGDASSDISGTGLPTKCHAGLFQFKNNCC